MRLQRHDRAGMTVVESAVVFPVTFLLILGLIVGGLGVFRYQEMASLARRAARYAAVHGAQYARDTGNPAATADDIYNNAIKPYAASLDLTKLTYAVSYSADNSPATVSVQNGNVVNVTNTVTVTVTYNWVPEAFLGGITLTSTSVLPMAY
jgi:Flp pilus assembly protein TadG